MNCKTKDFSSSFIIHTSHVVTGDLFKKPKPDGFIVGTYFKERGLWSNTVEPARVERMVEAVPRLRTGERPGVRGASEPAGTEIS